MPAKNKSRRAPKRSKVNMAAARPGDWVIHAAGAPQKVYAIGPALRELEEQLKEKGIEADAVEVFQVAADETRAFLGGGELQFLLH